MFTDSFVTRRELGTALLCLAVSSTFLACFEPKSQICPKSGRICPVACAADGETCISGSCGDGITQQELGEACDDGNKNDDDDCLSDCSLARCGDGVVDTKGLTKEACDYNDPAGTPCNLNCTIPACGDGIVTASAHEECDSHSKEDTASCNNDCTVPRCGDGHVNLAAGEQCDDGNKDDNDDCLSNCQWNRCGDGHVNRTPGHEEACDDGNTKTETECPYGAQSCKNYCNENCTALLTLQGHYCGDGKIDKDQGEVCDDGNSIDENACNAGVQTCFACSADCSQLLQLHGAVCGNGIVETGEACDDGNTESCGSCSSACDHPIIAAAATGRITILVPADIPDDSGFSINDGLHDRVHFAFDRNGHSSADVRIDIATLTTSQDVASAIAKAINDLPSDVLAISAEAQNNQVNLVERFKGYFRDRPIYISNNAGGFSVEGMTGGMMYRCHQDIGCTTDDDCEVGLQCSQNHTCE